MSVYVNVVKVSVETEKGVYVTHALAGDKTTYLKKNVDRYAKAVARRHKAAVVFYDCSLMTRVRVDFAHQLCMDYKNHEMRMA